MKSGFAVLIGRSNVGKSTLMNTLIGTKVSITTPKPQTTRRPVQGVLTDPDVGQVVFVDTPGIMQKAKDPLTKALNKYIEQSLRDIEVVIYVVDPTRQIGSEERHVLAVLRDISVPKLLVINKTDDPEAKRFIDFYRDLKDQFDDIIEVSAKTGSHLNQLKLWIFDHLPEGELMYPDFDVSNMTKEEQIAELIREKLFLRLREEVPYTTHVVTNEITERQNGMLYINATVFTTDDRYQGMIIGKGAQGIREIGQSTRKELEAVTGKKVYLDLLVEVDPHWVDRLTDY